MSAHSRTTVLYRFAHPCALADPGASMRLVLGTIFKKAEQMLGFFYVCPLEDQGPLPLRASMRSRGSWRVLVLVALRASVRSRASWHILVLVEIGRASCRERGCW